MVRILPGYAAADYLSLVRSFTGAPYPDRGWKRSTVGTLVWSKALADPDFFEGWKRNGSLGPA